MTSLILPRAAGWPRAGEARISAFGRQLGCRTLLLPTAAGWADAAGILARTGGVGTLETAPVGGVLSRRSAISSVWSDYLQDRGYLDPAEGYWWVFRSRLTAVAGNWGGILARTQDNSTASGWAWQRTNSDQLYVYHGGSNWYLGVSMSSLVDGEDHVLLGLWRKAESRLELWRDGKLFAAANGITTAPPYAAGQGQVKILSSRDTPNIVGSAALAALGVGNLSAGAAAAISGDVGLLFARRRQVLYFDTGGGAAALVIPGDAHGHSADAPALSTALALSIAASAHAHMADGLALSSAQVLAVADALHAHAAASLALSGDSALAVGGDAHAHAAAAMTLSAAGADDLAIAGDGHGHVADAVALTSASVLAVAGALHAHGSDTAELGAALALSISGGLHAHNAASLTLTDVPTLGAADALHAHGAASLALSSDVLLAIADAVHAHLADDVDMTYAATLAILESMHAHAADSLALTSGGGSALGLPDEIRVAIRERFILTVAAERRILRS